MYFKGKYFLFIIRSILINFFLFLTKVFLKSLKKKLKQKFKKINKS
jgi:hypothetical protein